mgnify:CR=1 FL=1
MLGQILVVDATIGEGVVGSCACRKNTACGLLPQDDNAVTRSCLLARAMKPLLAVITMLFVPCPLTIVTVGGTTHWKEVAPTAVAV